MKITVLGCGTSGGVPRIGNHWGDCDPENPKNRRRRVSVLVESGGKTILIDTSPDLREQLLSAKVNHLDGVFYTHDHADHSHGIDDLRGLYQNNRERIEIYGNLATINILKTRFDYIFRENKDYPAICNANIITPYMPLNLAGLGVLPFDQVHGSIRSLGYRFSKFAYSTDLNDLSEEAFAALEGVEVWLVDALRYKPHPTHTHLENTLKWIERVKPKKTYLTHMNWDMDYDTLMAELPDHVEPAYDGLVIEI
jgi:phosphoribosyl 1,2-cyclic phosphate phosphodiesterase